MNYRATLPKFPRYTWSGTSGDNHADDRLVLFVRDENGEKIGLSLSFDDAWKVQHSIGDLLPPGHLPLPPKDVI